MYKKILGVILAFAIAILCFLFLDVSTSNLTKTKAPFLNKSWKITFRDKTWAQELPLEIKCNSEDIIVAEKIFSDIESSYLVIPSITANAFRIYLNDKLIGGQGLWEDPTGTLWPPIYVYKLTDNLQKENLLRIEMKSQTKVLLPISPYSTSNSSILLKADLVNLLRRDVFYIAMGFCLLLSIIMFLSAKSIPESMSEYFQIGMALFLMTLAFPKNFYIQSWGSTEIFNALEKIFYAMSYMGTAFLLGGLEKALFGRMKTSKYAYPIISIVSIGLLLQPSIVTTYTYIDYANFAILILQCIIILRAIASLKPALIFPFAFLGLTATHDAFMIFKPSFEFPLKVYGIIVAVGGIGLFLFKRIELLNIEKEEALKKSIIDSLTGSYNRGVLETEKVNPGDCIIVIDMDKMKAINDNFGHHEGDRMIINLVSLFKNNLRSNDLVIRTGGDEFLLIIRNCSISNGNLIMERVAKQFQKEAIAGMGSLSYGIVASTGKLTEDVTKADELMYDMKKSHFKKSSVTPKE